MSKDIPLSPPASRPPPFFLADSLALDFLNSIAEPFGEPLEWVTNGEDLIAWLEKADLISPEIAAQVRSHASAAELDAVAAKARDLREWFRVFVIAHRGKPLSARALKDLAPLNDLLAQDESYLAIRVRAAQVVSEQPPVSALECSRQRRWRTASSLLLPLAETMATLVSSADFSDVKQCEGLACSILMLDTTQRRARRWCSMAVCGNRAKQAAHRHRLKRKKTGRKGTAPNR